MGAVTISVTKMMKGFQAFLAFVLVQQVFCGGVLHSNDGPVDLNKDEFCTDVSQYSDKYYEEEPDHCCTTMYIPNCEKKFKEVCMDVTDTICKPFAHPTNDIDIVNNPSPGNDNGNGNGNGNPGNGNGGPGTKAVLEELEADLFECKPVDVVLSHIKQVPQCENKTSLNCETGWKVVNGNKVWSGDEDCEEVTWQDCKLVEKEVPFHAVESRCGPANPPRESYATCKNKTVDVPVPVTRISFVQGTTCEPVTHRECVNMEYEDCSKPIRMEACSEVNVRKPKQDFIHKKKCLLPSDIQRLSGGLYEQADGIALDFM